MTSTIRTTRDWTYRAAQLRLQRAGRDRLPCHVAGVQLDLAGNRVVVCQCGWRGNGLGWLAHVDQVIGDAMRD